MWVWDSEKSRMVNRDITYVPGFYKIVDEILVNAADNKVSCFPPPTRVETRQIVPPAYLPLETPTTSRNLSRVNEQRG